MKLCIDGIARKLTSMEVIPSRVMKLIEDTKSAQGQCNLRHVHDVIDDFGYPVDWESLQIPIGRWSGN
jgi:hypothetical protein